MDRIDYAHNGFVFCMLMTFMDALAKQGVNYERSQDLRVSSKDTEKLGSGRWRWSSGPINVWSCMRIAE